MKRNLLLIIVAVIGATILLGILLPPFLTSEQESPEGDFVMPVWTPTDTQAPAATQQTSLNTGAQLKTPQVTPGRNCTYNIYYWKDHPEEWIAQIVFGGVAYDLNAAKRLIGGTEIPLPAPDTTTRLNQQLYVAFLNVSNGADGAVVDKVMADANQWLLDNPPGTQMSEFNQQLGNRLADDLERFNNGEIGPGPCEGQPPTPTASPQVFNTLAPSATVRPRQTGPTKTPNPTNKPGPRKTQVSLTNTPPPLPPTQTSTSAPPPPPQPTNTSAPPPPPTSTIQPTIPPTPTPVPNTIVVPTLPVP